MANSEETGKAVVVRKSCWGLSRTSSVVVCIVAVVICSVITGVAVWQSLKDANECNVSPSHAPPATPDTGHASAEVGGATVRRGDKLALEIRGDDGNIVLSGELGLTTSGGDFGIHTEGEGRGKTIKVTWPNETYLQIRHDFDLDPEGGCHQLLWRSERPFSQLTDCLDMSGAHWFGGAEMFQQTWPIGKFPKDFDVYVANENIREMYGAVSERLWWSSLGAGVHVPDDVPLHVSINASGDGRLCLRGEVTPPYKWSDQSPPWLRYTVCKRSDVKTIHRFLYDKFIVDTPSDRPNSDVILYPIWSTWAQYKTNITQAETLQFAKDIQAHGFRLAQLEIDDDWTPHYGDLVFDAIKFPQPRAMVDQLHAMGINVTVWVHPFKNVDSEAFLYGAEHGLLVTNTRNDTPALTSWWAGNKMAGLVDITNPRAASWFLGELRNLQTAYGVDSFKFDAGEVTFLPQSYLTHEEFQNPDRFTTEYAYLAASSDPSNRLEVRTGRHTQRLPVLVRMDDKYSTWSYDEGLKTLIPTTLQFGILGYPFVLPDMVGGNEYNQKADKELYVRWAQATALLPSIQFSIPPWRYDQEVVEICRDLMKLREQNGDLLLQLAQEAVETGVPMARPTWWVAPAEQGALQAEQQFLLGDSLLVAPVVDQGATTTKIYLPSGSWHDELRGDILEGGRWLDYHVTLRDLPRFKKIP